MNKFKKYDTPQFPWPPPRCFFRKNIVDDLSTKANTFLQVNTQIQFSLDSRGYFDRSYFQIPGGFAIATQLEQFEESGSIKKDYRWVDYPVQEFDGILGYLTALIMPNPGHFRIFVFVVTDQPYNQSQHGLSKVGATSLVSKGFNILPPEICNKKITNKHYLDVLIYEFEAPISTRKCTPKCYSRLDCQQHLKMSGLHNLGF